MRRPPFQPSSLVPLLLAALVSLAPLTAPALDAQGGDGEAPLLALAHLSLGGGVELPPLDPAVPTPDGALGHRLGERFTRYEDLRRYLADLAAASPRVSLSDYGTTYEGRPLTLVVVTSAGNQARLAEIRGERPLLADPAALAGDERERLLRAAPVVVWLGYGVHGNEPSSSEAAMATAYALAAAGGEWEEILDRTVVVIDPLSNPDGRERYVGAYEQRRGRLADPAPAATEHGEPWPGGRHNHYLIDLNRDWTWATQRETRHRLVAYRAWEPQVYVDFHEMSSDSTYFFPPTAEPVNPEIDAAVVDWLAVFGAANAAAFDRQGWLYYKAESFDLFYPGYGDSYPSFRGAVGMTYEVGGGGRGGEALLLPDGEMLTLADRVARHLTTSLVTVATAAAHRQALLADFVAGRGDRRAGAPTTYLWQADQPEAAAMAAALAQHGLRVGRLSADLSLAVRPLSGGEIAPRGFAAGTFAVSTAQPLGNLARTLLEPETPMPESFLAAQRRRVEDNLGTEFFDVTAWSLPLAFNVAAWVADGGSGDSPAPTAAPTTGLAAAVDLPALPDPERELPPAAAGRIDGDGELGYLLPPQGVAGCRATARLLAAGTPVRVALDGFTAGGRRYPAGTAFFPRSGAPADLDARVAAAADDAGVELYRAASSAASEGISLGSDRFPAVVRPRIGLIGGDGAGATSFGFLWHLFDRQLELAVTRLDAGRLDRIELAAFDVLILPDGDWDGRLSDKVSAALEGWVRGGGLLVAVGGAVDWLQARELTAVEDWGAAPAEGSEVDDGRATREEKPPQIVTPGAILATRMRAGHPLTAGLPAPPPVLFEGSEVLRPTGDPQKDVLTADPDRPVTAGVAWPEARERLAGALLVASEPLDRGRIVLFAQEPDFRLFWRGTVPLLMNAVLYGPSWGVDRKD